MNLSPDKLNAFKLKSGKNIMYTFPIMVHIANVYIIFLPDFNEVLQMNKCILLP